jgi:hypothetical protein
MKIAGIAAVVAGALLSSAAHAATFDVTVWTGANDGVQSKTFANNIVPTGLASAHFTWLGDIDWFVDGPQNNNSSGNLVSDFLGGSANISGFSSPRGTYANLADFLDDSLSVNGDAYATFFKITGVGKGHGTITHDDGASVYDYNGAAVYASPSETSAITGQFDLPTGAHPFTVYYVEGNGSPSVLNLSVAGVPEPATWATMMLGVAGLGAVLRRRREQSVFA